MTIDDVVARAIEELRQKQALILVSLNNSFENEESIWSKSFLRIVETHLGEFEEHSQMTRWLHDDVGGSFASPEEALNWYGEKDAEYEEEVARLSTFTVCRGCGEKEAEFADHLGIDEWTYSPLIYGECSIARDKAKRLMGEE